MRKIKGRKSYSKPVKWNKSGKIAKRSSEAVHKKRKNNRFIQRGKETVETHRQQKVIEDKYREQSRSSNYNDENIFGDNNDKEEEETNPFDELVAVLAKGQTKSNTAESESDDEDEQLSEAEDEQLEAYTTDDSEVENIEIDSNYDKKKEGNTKIDDNEKNAHDEEDEESDDEIYIAEATTANRNDLPISTDTFALHLDYELPADYVDDLLDATKSKKKSTHHWPHLGNVHFEMQPQENFDATDSEGNTCLLDIKVPAKPSKSYDLNELKSLGVKATLATNAMQTSLTPLQAEIFAILNNYQDLFYPQRSLDKGDEVRKVYCLHALNHMLKTRSRIVHHNAKLKTTSLKNPKSKKNVLIPDCYRDQGLVRPKVIFILPYRDSAYRVVNQLIQLLYGIDATEDPKTASVINYERFASDYTGNSLYFPKTNPKPVDYEQTFTGNTDDNFRIGISLTKKCLKLYTEFYASDILIASPLGLRMIVGAVGSAERDYDFLNSIELLIIDQAELILAQNWENLLHVLDHLHLQPQSLRPDTDFQRVRPWCLSGLSRFYRQSLLFTSHELPEFRALFSSKCSNYRGQVRIINPVVEGEVRNVIVAIPQVFHRLNVNSLDTQYDDRFNYFVTEILPRFRAPSFAHCMVYVPSYFDFVRLRNYFKSETMNFVQICEYTKCEKIARARDMFFHSGAHFILYSERAHFFRRTRIKGIRHLIMYQPPIWPHFYAEMCNQIHTANQNRRDGLEDSMSITVLYSKYDVLQLSGILGSERAAKLIQSGKVAHAFAAE